MTVLTVLALLATGALAFVGLASVAMTLAEIVWPDDDDPCDEDYHCPICCRERGLS